MRLPFLSKSFARVRGVGFAHARTYALRPIWLVIVLAFASGASAQREPHDLGSNSAGLCGLVYAGAARCPTGLSLSGTAGYGVTKLQGTHHRVLGNLGLGYVPLPWLAVSLELAGRIDMHPADEHGGAYTTATGDPWLRGRVGFPVSPRLDLGGELGIWLPGNAAPSFSPSATTVDLKALLTWKASTLPLTLLSSLGTRIDNSANSAPEPLHLRYGDQIALGLSDSHALLIALGLAYAPLPALLLFGELSGQILLGEEAPSFLESPLRAAIGARYFIGGLALELTAIPSLSQRPNTAADAPLVPIEPRFTMLAGLRYDFLRASAKGEQSKPSQAHPIEPEARPEEQLVTLRGALRDEAGKPIPDAKVTITHAAGNEGSVSQVDGSFSFAGLRSGTVTLRAEAPGFQPSTWEVAVMPSLTEVLTHTLVAESKATGSLRCLVRSFGSEPLRAQIVVRDLSGKRVASGTTDANGLLELPLAPGQYRVAIDATGYQSRRSNVQVSPHEVAILNVDLRER
jgi:hypothetical protein